MRNHDGRPLYHLYFVKQKGAAILRVARYKTEYHGERPAAWPVRDTAKYFGREMSKDGAKFEGQPYRVFTCTFDDCPVCREYLTDNPPTP